MLSAVFLGMTAAGKYVHAVVGIAILFHFLLAVLRKELPRRLLLHMLGWGALSLVMFFVFDPYLWPHPIARLMKSVLFHQDFQDSRLVQMYSYPFWQPLRWLSAFSSYYDLGPASAFLVNIDTFIFVAAIVGLPRLSPAGSLSSSTGCSSGWPSCCSGPPSGRNTRSFCWPRSAWPRRTAC